MADITSLAEQLVQGGTAGAFEPQRKNNWFFLVEDTALKFKPVIVALETGFAPTEETEEGTVDFLNEKKYYAGKTTWAEGTIVLKDFVDRGSAAFMMAWRQLVYVPQTGKINFASKYKKDAKVILFGPDGSADREWTLHGAWPRTVKYGDLDMTSTETVKIECSIRYDKAIPTKPGNLEGNTVNSGPIQAPAA